MILFHVLRAGHRREGPWRPSVNRVLPLPSFPNQLLQHLSLCGSFYKMYLTVWVSLASYYFCQGEKIILYLSRFFWLD